MTHDEEIVDPTLLTRYRDLLRPEELERMRRFRQARHSHQHLVARALLRHVLALYLPVPPVALRFATNDFGKPHLVAPASHAPCFNLSHTDGRVVVALAADGDIGVDIEAPPRTPVPLEVANRYFAPGEVEQLERTPALLQAGRFLDFWTLKEAYIKACGEGMSIPLDHFAYHFDAGQHATISFAPERGDWPGDWRFWQVLPDSGHRIAIAHRGLATRVAGPLTIRTVVPLLDHRIVQLRTIASAPDTHLIEPA
jgi:4'-phosphopantetheinyl transferase